MSALLLGRLQPRARRVARAVIQGPATKALMESVLFQENYYASGDDFLPAMTGSAVGGGGQLYTARSGGVQVYTSGEAPTGSNPAYFPIPRLTSGT